MYTCTRVNVTFYAPPASPDAHARVSRMCPRNRQRPVYRIKGNQAQPQYRRISIATRVDVVSRRRRRLSTLFSWKTYDRRRRFSSSAPNTLFVTTWFCPKFRNHSRLVSSVTSTPLNHGRFNTLTRSYTTRRPRPIFRPAPLFKKKCHTHIATHASVFLARVSGVRVGRFLNVSARKIIIPFLAANRRNTNMVSDRSARARFRVSKKSLKSAASPPPSTRSKSSIVRPSAAAAARERPHDVSSTRRVKCIRPRARVVYRNNNTVVQYLYYVPLPQRTFADAARSVPHTRKRFVCACARVWGYTIVMARPPRRRVLS